MLLKALFCLSTILPFVADCRSVPVTERTQLMLSSSAQEKEAGAKAYAEYRAKYKRSGNAAYNEALANCGTVGSGMKYGEKISLFSYSLHEW